MIRIGTAGWSYPDWEGVVYPAHKPAGFHPLRYLSRYVDCVEINSSFYGTPRAEAAQRWLELAGERQDFRFLAKLEQTFTHAAWPEEPSETRAKARAFLAGIEPLRAAGRLGALLVQFPRSFRAGPAASTRLAAIDTLFGHLPLVLEVRHRSWFEEESLDEIERLGWSLATIDLPSAPDHPPSQARSIGAVGYHRLHGRNAATWSDPRAGRDQRYDYLYGPDELEQVLETTRRVASGRAETFVILNNHFSGKAVANALELLAAITGTKPLAPAEIVQAYPRLGEVVRVEGQGSLF